jgi:CDP-4-dehydro-6-deoxyglucose reductase
LTASAVNRSSDTITETSYQITVQPGGEQFNCGAQQSILLGAHAANVLISYSCRSGQCGSCLGRLLAGKVSYPRGQPAALSREQQEEGYALFCSAYAVSDLTIELIQPEFPS